MLSKDLFGKLHVTPRPMVEPESVPVELSSKPENPNQYKLFMRPQELMDTIKRSVDEGIVSYQTRRYGEHGRVMNALWHQKSAELKGYPYHRLVDSIAQHGVLRPITIEDYSGTPLFMGQGHHRVVAAHQVEQQTGRQIYIPVVYNDDYNHTDNENEYPMTDVERSYRKPASTRVLKTPIKKAQPINKD
jgi:hypothetical protein